MLNYLHSSMASSFSYRGLFVRTALLCIVLTSCALPSYVMATEEASTNVISTLKSIISQSSEDFINQWNDHITSIHSANIKELGAALSKIEQDYQNAVEGYAKGISICESQERKYNNGWTKQLLTDFDLNYLKLHIQEVKDALVYLHLNSYSTCLISEEKELLYFESRYRQSILAYLDELIAFLESYSPSESDFDKQKFILSISALAEVVKTNLVSALLKGEAFRLSIYEQKAKGQSAKVYKTLSKNPLFLKPFDLIKALDDLTALTEEGK